MYFTPNRHVFEFFGCFFSDSFGTSPGVLYTVARTRGGVVHRSGITVIGTPGACASAVMPGVRSTPGQSQPGDVPGDIRGVVPRVLRYLGEGGGLYSLL